MTKRKLSLSALTIDPTVNVRERTDQATVDHYAEILDQLPPVVVFDGGLLADGFHRVEAAIKLGRASIAAEVHKGDRTAALIFAASANSAHGRPLTQKERRAAAERLLGLGKLHKVAVARQLGMDKGTITEIARSICVRNKVGIPTSRSLSPSHSDMISRAPEEFWQPLAEAAIAREWTAHETRQAVQVVKDDRTAPRHREEVLAGRADPFALNEDGEPEVSVDTIQRRVRNAKQHGLASPLQALLSAAATLELRVANGEEFEDRLSPADRRRLDASLEQLQSQVPRLRQMLVGTIRPVAVSGGQR